MRKKVGTQVIGGLELQTNWDKISSHNQYHELFGKGEDGTSIVAHNEHTVHLQPVRRDGHVYVWAHVRLRNVREGQYRSGEVVMDGDG